MRPFALTRLISMATAVLISACTGAGTSGSKSIDFSHLPKTIDVFTAKALLGRDGVVMIDVREPFEFNAGHIGGVELIPLGQIPARLAEISKEETVILTCRTGNRSGQAADYLRQQGYTKVHNLQGGIVAWEQAGMPIEK